jgi:hypothetical protein
MTHTTKMPQVERSDFNPRYAIKSLSYYNHKTDFQYITDIETFFLHENAHFLDHIGTSYGHFLDRLSYFSSNICRHMLSLFKADGAPPLPVPFRNWITDIGRLENLLREKSRNTNSLEVCLDYICVLGAVWPSLIHLERTLEGECLESVLSMDPAYPIAGFRCIEALDGQGSLLLPDSINELTRLQLSEDWSAPESGVPIVKAWGRNNPIGAISILESRAFIYDLGVEENKSGRQKLLSVVESSNSYEYLNAWLLIMNDCLRCLGTDMKASDMNELDIKEALDTFLVLSDLALSPPVCWPYARLRTKNSWSDLHPGWRLCRLAEMIGRIGIFKRSQEMDIFDFQDQYCRALNWPSQREILSVGSHTEFHDFRGKRHSRACNLKLKYPRFFVNPNLTYLALPSDEELYEFYKNCWPFIIIGDGKSMTKKGDEGEIMERLVLAYTQRFYWSIFVDGDVDNTVCLDPGFDYKRLVSLSDDHTSINEVFAKALVGKAQFIQC